ncbi:unnamed protein product [Porites lobata]|uniref:Uncharacterized protein n=1 Tax=Porites lobata TaxID=104759 RepID=A0ABN8N739_9CNID|nr:unnamed protein product [Porites lobata]
MVSSSRISASSFQESMRRELTARAHSSHQGIEACIRRAKDVVFLPLNDGGLEARDSRVVPDGYEDDQIHCLKDGQLCHAGTDRLTSIQQAVPASRATNPFADVTMSDIEGAAPDNSLIDLSDNEIEIEIE